MNGLGGKRILLGVSGGIAAYKAADLVRRLRERGAVVQVVMTEGAKRFVTPLTFQALSGRPVRDGLFDEAAEAAMGHIELARWADLVLVAPASADLLARLAQGRADDLLTTLCLATAAPVFVAPAMNHQMWAHAATQANIDTLRTRGVMTLGPGVGDQACGEEGAGRLLEPLEIATAVEAELGGPGPLSGSRVVITAGPTHEPIDPVRYIGNRSSGRMGYAVAEACLAAGAEVSLVSGPVKIEAAEGVRVTRVETAEQMFAAVQLEVEGADLFIGTAAIADFRPTAPASDKLKKRDGAPEMGLTENPDILAWVGSREPRPFTVGFAAETGELEANARDKLQRKHLDMIAANLVGGGLGFDAADNALSVYWTDGGIELQRADKSVLARELVALISTQLRADRAVA
jgi:phosphopantothenoylcysteine decarboxylase / phosphopantothenate---cysteine ligase